MKKIGIDLGSSSVGWSITDDRKMIKNGVITFETGMTKGTGGYTSPTKDRREARSKRNLIRSRKYRKRELLEVLINNDFVPLDEAEFETWSKYRKGRIRRFPENNKFLKWLACDFTYEGGEKYKNPYELRVRALDNKVSKHEFGRALYHLVQRRGYKDIGETDKETKIQIERRDEGGFKKALDNNGGIISKALLNDFLNKDERARNQYPYREEYEKELEVICEAQGFSIEKNEKKEYQDELIQKLWKSIIWQQPLKTQKGKIGKCTLEPNKLRCPISHPMFEIFRAWSFINTIKYFDENDEKQFIPTKMREKLFAFFLKKGKNFKFEDIRVFLDKQFQTHKKYNYPINTKTQEYDTSVSGMPVCKGLIDLFGDEVERAINSMETYFIGNAPKIVARYSIYDLWHILFDFDKQHLGEFAIEKLKIDNISRKRKGQDISISPLVELKNQFQQGYSDLSLKAMSKIIPFLKEGFLYNEAAVLAKIPELIGSDWENKKTQIIEILRESSEKYQFQKKVIGIVNNLIDKHKGSVNAVKEGMEEQTLAYKDFSYTLAEGDIQDVKNACVSHFGEDTWKRVKNQEEIIENVKLEYQEYFFDQTRAYRKLSTLTDIFKERLNDNRISLNGELYHHSNRENLYNKNLEVNFKTGEKFLPKHKETNIEILPIPFIDSIKNPMFNKSMSVLRKLVNELIVNGDIDNETEVIIEIARELNDNNKRVAIERYQKERRDNREKIRKFLQQYNELESQSINIDEKIPIFELWTEQIFEETEDENKSKITNKNRIEILREEKSVRRYELWMEQKGQCMYTGKMISIAQLFSNEIDIDHTIPRSILPDNTMANKTVAFARYNRDIKEAVTPYYCENFSQDTKKGTSIQPRLDHWKKLRDYYKIQYESRQNPKGAEDENVKNKRIQEKHYYKLHFDYWKDKVERFEAEEITDRWIRRQLVDTQMVSKYAREFLKLYFKKVAVQKGSVTADFRKIFGFQEEDEIKSRNKHTHHSVDAAVLTLIPTNSSYREQILKEYYEAVEQKYKSKLEQLRKRILPPNFNSQSLINKIENETLIVNYKKDKTLQQTAKIVRKRGKIQYVKNKKGEFVLDENGNKIIKKAKGDSVRSSLYAQTYLGKIRDVERYSDGQPVREKGDWKYKKGKDEFIYTVRKPINEVISKTDDIIDPVIRRLVIEQKDNEIIKDYQGNAIRHVRIKVKAGREVKKRVNYLSEHEYKNKFYAEAGSVPYAILLQKTTKDGLSKELLPIVSSDIAKEFKNAKKFDVENFINTNYPDFNSWQKQLLKVGQKVFVLKDDMEFEKRQNINFMQKRLYVITKFSEGSIWLKYHLNALPKEKVKELISLIKDEKLSKFEKEFGISEVKEDMNIKDNKMRKDDYKKRKFRFDTIDNSYRLTKISKVVGLAKAQEIKKELDKYKVTPSTIELEGETPFLKMVVQNCNFLYEGKDFEISLDGTVRFK